MRHSVNARRRLSFILYYSSNHVWGQSGTDNNGNVHFAETWIPPENATLDQQDTLFEDSYSYDSLNRLASVTEQKTSVAGNSGTWTQQFHQQYTYDRYGNRTIDAVQTSGAGINNKQFSVNVANNRLGVPSGQSGTMTYDLAGNLINDTYSGAGAREYDAENKMTRAWGGNNQWQEYTYNADGQRVRRKTDGYETWQIYGIDGELLAEYAANGSSSTAQKEYGYRNGELLITASPGSGDQSLNLNGTSAYMQAPNSSSLNISGALTVEAWIKVNAITGAYQDIITRESYGQAGSGGGYELSVTNTGKLRLDTYQSPTAYTTLIGNTTITTGVWHHVAGVFDGSQMRVYRDGVLDGTLATTNAPASGTSSLKLGRTSVGSYFGGLIDEARVSNTAIYTSNFTPQTHLSASSSTKGLWKFDGPSTADSSGNGNNGTLQGGATYLNDVPGGAGSSSSGPQTQWLVADHLGTPRMIVDQSGSLASVKRHDYLPFGEELYAGRTALGYTGGDGVRQQFTRKERDVETGLDYFEARYYASTQGRFTSPDPLLASGQANLPQSWNRYTYAVNNPLINVDPTGLWWYTKDGGDGHPEWFDDDPGKGYTRFNKDWYYAGEKYGYVALDPYSKNYQIGFDTEDEASAYSNQLASETLQSRDPGQYVSQLDGTLEVATYISGVQGLARIGIAAGESLLVRETAQETATVVTQVATQATIHGAERLAARGFTEADIVLTKTGAQFLQRDGATVFLKEVTPGKFNVIVEGSRGVVTALKNVSEKSVARLSANYGWFSPIAK